MTLTPYKVKVKVTEHLNFRQLPINAYFQVYLLRHFRVELKTDGWRYWQYRTWSTACRSPIVEFPSTKGITIEFKLHGMLIFHDIQNVHIFGYWVMLQSHGWVRCACWCDLDPIQGKVKVTGLLNFRQLEKPCMLACWRRWPQPPCRALWSQLFLRILRQIYNSFIGTDLSTRLQRVATLPCETADIFRLAVADQAFFASRYTE